MHRYASSPLFFPLFSHIAYFPSGSDAFSGFFAWHASALSLRWHTLSSLVLPKVRSPPHCACISRVLYAPSMRLTSHTLSSLVLPKVLESTRHCDCELLAALLSVVSRGIFTETSRQPTEPLSVRPLHAPRAALPPPLSRSDPSDRCAYCSAPAVPALCSAPRRTRCSPCSPEPLRGSLPRSAPRFRTPRSP